MAKTPEALLQRMIVKFAKKVSEYHWVDDDTVLHFGGTDLFESGPAFSQEVVLLALEEYRRFRAELEAMLASKPDASNVSEQPYLAKRIEGDAMELAIRRLIKRKLKWTDEELLALLAAPMTLHSITPHEVALTQIKKLVKPKNATLSPLVLARLLELAKDPAASHVVMADPVIRDLVEASLSPGDIQRSAGGLKLDEGNDWVRALRQALDAEAPDEQQKLLGALYCVRDATTSKPTVAWSKSAAEALAEANTDALRRVVLAGFHAVPAGRHDMEPDADTRFAVDTVEADYLRGLTWLLVMDPWPGLAAELADLLVTSLKKLPFQGPRCVKLANGCIWSLGEMAAHGDEAVRMSALAQLAKLKGRVTFKTTLTGIQKALTKAAAAAGVSVEELEELGVPAFGFEAGELVQEIGGSVATLSVDGTRIVTAWTNDKGKSVKTAPAAVRRDHKEEVKELKRIAKDAEAILGGTRARLDGLYLRNASWPLEDWRERYLEHGLIGPLVRRLIWSADGTAFLPLAGGFTGPSGALIEVEPSASVRLWHPIDSDTGEVMEWRRHVEDLELMQPFKQAHREVYVLTDAERQTGVYSNRFAAHIVKQHQFAALAKARGWNHTLRLMVDDSYRPTHRLLPAFGLRAEFWVEGAGDNYGTDTTEAGSYLHLATDQVRFYREGAAAAVFHATGGLWHGHGDVGPGDEPLAVDTIDPVVFSEIMRDADLFVGVTSVSNDPNWADGGREPAQETYWHTTSFGELSATAETRKDILSRLIPRLKIADRCELEGRFLKVRGERRTYKIHLGSANILMEPNDQYLCIVPSARATNTAAAKVFLPFEGDRTLSIVLSKAFLLADDLKIDDPTIISQIEGRQG